GRRSLSRAMGTLLGETGGNDPGPPTGGGRGTNDGRVLGSAAPEGGHRPRLEMNRVGRGPSRGRVRDHTGSGGVGSVSDFTEAGDRRRPPTRPGVSGRGTRSRCTRRGRTPPPRPGPHRRPGARPPPPAAPRLRAGRAAAGAATAATGRDPRGRARRAPPWTAPRARPGPPRAPR